MNFHKYWESKEAVQERIVVLLTKESPKKSSIIIFTNKDKYL